MASNRSNGDSWADQWGYNDQDEAPGAKKDGGSSKREKYKQKIGEGLGKTKSRASSGVKKVKEGTTLGINWIKDKYHKTTQKDNNSY